MDNVRDIPQYEGLYFADINGNIYSSPKRTRRGSRKLRQTLLSTGYNMVSLCKDKAVNNVLVHRIVAETFLLNPENKPQVNHINGIKNDNRVINLEWNTISENQKHSIRIGLRHTRGEKNSSCKINAEIALKILNDNRKYGIIGKEYGVSVPTVSNIKKGISWTHVTGVPPKRKIKPIIKHPFT